MTAPAIQTADISKNYGKLKAVDRVSLNVDRGEIYGFLGLNGAGKTTTIRMLLGLITPDSGTAFLNGEKVSPGNTRLWKNVGYLVEVPYSYPDLTVKENLEAVSRLRLLNDQKATGRIIDLLKLDQYIDVKAKNLSLGNSQRLGLAKALIHEPDILVLDEPANGLDPAGIVEIRELLLDLSINRNVTIFISSHILGEISKFATRIGIIHNGILLYESPVDEMINQRKTCLQVKTDDPENTSKRLREKGFIPVITDGGILEIPDKEAIANPSSIASLLVESGFSPSLLKVEEEDLETFFLRVINMKGGAE